MNNLSFIQVRCEIGGLQSAASDSSSIIPYEGDPECFTDLFSYQSLVRRVHALLCHPSCVSEDDAVLSQLSVSNQNICRHHGCLSSGVFIKRHFSCFPATHKQACLFLPVRDVVQRLSFLVPLSRVSQKQLR